ncbi:Ubiquitin-conjugating enzyme E2 C [Rhodotorula toruloides]|uniref:BY PROTMAP: gi/472583750/gb/EMS21374.1/ ubiquitin-conjugating enzyme E2 C [Rhodosporidium toruloides NP11] gi/647402168/emb/CDR48448.1/ RHTO0S18e00276g1_1 [Rhodosporidium toruloides] n=2 Tax=Rhodotorula toruloides TaxID=5286 RepID=A0A0K3C9Q0_RHOTO
MTTANPTTAFPAASIDGQSPKASVSASGQASSAANVAKRLQSELMSLMMSPPAAGISAFPESDSDLTYWVGRLEGAEGTVYEGHVYAISLRFPPEYPYKAPVVRFESTCYHPNVDLHGNICLDILKEKWSPALSVSTILVSLQSLLGEPNNASPLNVEAAELWDDVEAYKVELAKHYQPLPEDE